MFVKVRDVCTLRRQLVALANLKKGGGGDTSELILNTWQLSFQLKPFRRAVKTQKQMHRRV